MQGTQCFVKYGAHGLLIDELLVRNTKAGAAAAGPAVTVGAPASGGGGGGRTETQWPGPCPSLSRSGMNLNLPLCRAGRHCGLSHGPKDRGRAARHCVGARDSDGDSLGGPGHWHRLGWLSHRTSRLGW